MPGEAVQLGYSTDAKSRLRFFHIFILPLLWLPAGIGSRIYYGDEYVSCVIANVPALPLMLLVQNRFALRSVFLIAMVFNFILMVALGHLMDRVRVPRWSYLIFLVLAALLILSGTFAIGSVQRPTTLPPAARFYPQALCPAWAIALYIFTIVAIIVGFSYRTKLRR